jgi:hypothetical protein
MAQSKRLEFFVKLMSMNSISVLVYGSRLGQKSKSRRTWRWLRWLTWVVKMEARLLARQLFGFESRAQILSPLTGVKASYEVGLKSTQAHKQGDINKGVANIQ